MRPTSQGANEMTQPPDPITNRKMVIAKQLYQRGIAEPTNGHPVSRLLAVIEFDLASETIIKAVVSSLGAVRSLSESFPGLIEQCENCLNNNGPGSLSNRNNLLYVHSIRNEAQHRARFPTVTEVSDCRTYTRDFLDSLLKEVWGLDLNSISLADVIQHPKVKQYLVDAELAREDGRFEDAIFNANAGLDWALMTVQGVIVGPELFDEVELLTARNVLGEPEKDRDISRAVSRMQRTLLYSTLGISSSELSVYKEIAGYTSFTINGDVQRYRGKKEPDADDADFVIGYSTQAITQVEAVVGDIEKPFGFDFWEQGLIGI